MKTYRSFKGLRSFNILIKIQILFFFNKRNLLNVVLYYSTKLNFFIICFYVLRTSLFNNIIIIKFEKF